MTEQESLHGEKLASMEQELQDRTKQVAQLEASNIILSANDKVLALKEAEQALTRIKAFANEICHREHEQSQILEGMERALSGLGDGTMARYKLVVAEHKPFKSDAHSVATEQEIERDLQSALAALEIEAGCLTDEPRNTAMWQMVSKAENMSMWPQVADGIKGSRGPKMARHSRGV